MTEKLMSLKELAAHMGISINTAKALPIPFTKVGKRKQRRYHPTLVRRYQALNASSPKDALAWNEVSLRAAS